MNGKVKFKRGYKKFTLKKRYSELFFSDLVNIERLARKHDEDSFIKPCLKVLISDPSLVDLMNDEQVEILKPYLAFLTITEIPSTSALQVFEKYQNKAYPNAKLQPIAQCTWSEFEAARIALKKHLIGVEPSISAALAEVVRIYTGIDIYDLPLIDARSIALFYKNEIEAFLSKYKRLNEYKPTPKEQQANVKRFEQFGFKGTLHALAKGNPLMYDDLLAMNVDVIYNTLLIDFEKADFQKRLAEINGKK